MKPNTPTTSTLPAVVTSPDPSFDYEQAGIKSDDAKHLERHAAKIGEIQATMRKATVDAVMMMGEVLSVARDRLANHGNGTFRKWAKERCGLSNGTISNILAAYEEFADSKVLPTVGKSFDASALYLLASQKCPDDVVAEAMERAEAGQHITQKSVREMIRASCPNQDADEAEASDDDDPLIDSPVDDEGLTQGQTLPHVAHNSGNVEWYTPNEILDAARAVLGTIDLDPASCEAAQERVKATTFYTADDDGLAHPWSGRVWLNPPYRNGLVAKFIGKLVDHIDAGDVTEAILLANNATETAWFQLAGAKASVICLLQGRVRFIDAAGKPSGHPLQGQAILYFGDRPEVFREAFKTFGTFIEPIRQTAGDAAVVTVDANEVLTWNPSDCQRDVMKWKHVCPRKNIGEFAEILRAILSQIEGTQDD